MLIVFVELSIVAPPLCTFAAVKLWKKLALAPLPAAIVPPLKFNVLTFAAPVWFALISVAVRTPPLRFNVPLVQPELRQNTRAARLAVPPLMFQIPGAPVPNLVSLIVLL